MIRALIVDDVDLAREAIRIRLQRETDIEVVGEASSGPDAISAIQDLSPNLIFLDVQMPGMDAFQVLEAIPGRENMSIVFITAHGEYALKAFEAHALHFLLKPIDNVQFKEALQRARRELASAEIRAAASRNMNDFLNTWAAERLRNVEAVKPARLTRLAVRDRDDFELVKVDDVDWIESAGHHAVLHTSGRTLSLRAAFGDLEEKLDAASFARISRSIIVNISRVRKIKALWHGDFQVVLLDGTSLRMSRRYRKRLIP